MEQPASSGNLTARCVLALLLIAAPLAYGSVDRSWQAVLTAVFAFGFLLFPPVVPKLPRVALASGVLLAGVFLLKEFLPSALLGDPRWKGVMAGEYGWDFPWTRSAQPAVAIHQLLVAGVAACWLLWVRSLACGRGGAAWVVGACVVAGVATGLASGVMKLYDPDAIYGVRQVLGWQKFGPFPNRNHTACILAMGAVASAGMVWHGVVRGRRFGAVAYGMAGVFLCGMVVWSNSRGGLLALVVGLAFPAAMAFWRSRDRRALVAAGVSMALLGGVGLLFFGGGMIERFFDPDRGGGMAAATRPVIWAETLRFWMDAPIVGHGLGSYRGAFPFYQEAWMDNTVVLHPESGWLQWLSEWGGLAMICWLALLGSGVVAFFRNARRGGVVELAVRSAAGGAVVVMAVHSLYDVPSHRWATAAMALAFLGVALGGCGRPGAVAWRPGWLSRVFPMVVAVFWMLPFAFHAPRWTPLALERFIGSLNTARGVSIEQADRMLAIYPMEPTLQELAGVLKLARRSTRDDAWRHFGILNRMMPNSWSIPAQQAILTSYYDPAMALNFWAEAVDRAGPRSYDVMRLAFQYTPARPEEIAFWTTFAQAHPETLLTLAEILSGEDARRIYAEWRRRRLDAPDLRPHEIRTFHRLVHRLGSVEDLLAWIESHPELAPNHQRDWATAFQQMGESSMAWTFLETMHGGSGDQSAAPPPDAVLLARMESRWTQEPGDWRNAGDYLDALWRTGADRRARDLRNRLLGMEKVPEWLRWKLAKSLAEDGRHRQAVDLVLGKP